MKNWLINFDDTFAPLQIDVESNSSMNVPGGMCHDFFEDAYYYLVSETGMLKDTQPEAMIFRDAVVMFAPSVQTAKAPYNWQTRREMARYFWFFGRYLDSINKDFTIYRAVAKSAAFALIPVFRHHRGVYYRAKFVYPYVNYCYLRVPVPPQRSQYFRGTDEEKACMLSMAYEVKYSDILPYFLAQINFETIYILLDILVDFVVLFFTSGIAAALIPIFIVRVSRNAGASPSFSISFQVAIACAAVAWAIRGVLYNM